MMNDLKLFCVLIIIICFNSYSQVDQLEIKKDIDSITKRIDNCLNCCSSYFRRGKLYVETGNKTEAMSDFNNAIELHWKYFEKNSDLTEYYNERAYLKMELNDYMGAIQDFNRASKINEGWSSLWVEVLSGRGYCKSQIGDLKGAVIEYEKVFLHDKNDANAYFNLGLLKIALGEKNEGCLSLSKAGELGYRDAYKDISELCN